MTAPTTKTRIPLAEALPIAERLVALLTPACERIEVAGSIRRRQPDIGDIEIVAVPKFTQGLQADLSLFNEIHRVTVDLIHEECGRLRQEGELENRPDKNGRPAWGPKFKRMMYEGIGVDLFSVIEPAQWGVIFAIRTGPADYSHQFVTAKNRTFSDSQGHERIGLCPPWLRVKDGRLTQINPTSGVVLAYHDTPEETDFFAAIGEPYREPWERA